jgi:hypothetical protein
MSIQAAVAALDKEIEALDNKRGRLVSLRDALVVEEGTEIGASATVPVNKGKPGPKPGAKKSGPTPTRDKLGPKPGSKKATLSSKAATPRKVATPKKRVMSPEAKKRIGDAVKARWAEKAKAKKAAQ